jgi:hypothetical protein
MAYDPEGGELLPDGSRIQTTTAGELADWLAEQQYVPCGCENPQPWELCCPARILIPAVRAARVAPTRRKRKR